MSVYHPQPKVPCVRCNKNHDTPAAFLMACAKCERAWHHTCHIPQVSEAEILERISFDRQGKRDAGLGGWQCKRCTKRARVETQTTVVAGTSAPTSTRTQERQSKTSPNGPANAPAGTMSNVRPQARPPAPVEIVIVDSDEDDIIVLDHGPEPSLQSVADRKNEAEIKHPPVGAEPTMDQQPACMSSKSPPPRQSTPAVVLGGLIKVQKTVKLSKTAQKRPAKSQLIITPLPTSREPSTNSKEPSLGSSTQPNHTSRPSPPLPPPSLPASEPEGAPSRTRSPTPIRHPQPMQPEPTILHITFPNPPVKTISTADIRALISTMRADGRLVPPPEFEYIQARPRDAGPANAKPPQSGARKLAYAPGHTPSPELHEVERKLEDFDDHDVEMEVDVDRRSNRDARREEELEEDPHNIDDLYGDIAPRYRSQPSRRSKSRSKTAPAPAPAPRRAPPAGTRLLSAKRDKRPPKVDDLGLLLDKMLWIEGRRSEENDGPVRAPRKAAATQRLKRKALRRKQKAGLYFSIHEERKRAAGG